MRNSVLLVVLIGLSACSADPKALGITGPGPQVVPVAPNPANDVNSQSPGVSTSGSYYGPSIGPIKSNSGFYGYN
jgi:hypothetical protein